MAGKLQEGIYFDPKSSPGKFFCILFLRAERGLTAPQIGESFRRLWEVYQGLKQGTVRDLPGHPVPSGELTVLVAYGPNVFKLADAGRSVPFDLRDSTLFRSPSPTGGGPLLMGSGLRYADDVGVNAATEDIAVQFIAQTQLAVNRAVVETWKLLYDMADPATVAAPLLLTGFYSGFQRDDRRSWIDFHDGISNIRSTDRHGAIAIKPSPVPEQQWTEEGTYLAFIRVAVDLSVWRKLSLQQQETMVGRDKLSGCPLVAMNDKSVIQGCPFAVTAEITDPGNQAFFEPPNTADPIVSKSHVQRANHHVGPVDDPGSLRVFRQGYEFLQPLGTAPGFRAGLNFVSFQDTPQRLLRMLVQEGWLGRVNFGGDPEDQQPGMARFLTVRAAGIFLAPPVVDGESFPGASIFGV